MPQTAIDKNLSAEIKVLNKRLEILAKEMTRKELKKEVLRPAAKPVVEAARTYSPVGSRTHYRYKTPKLVGKLKAPKGLGVRIATYIAGNLKGAIRILNFRRSTALFVGPKRSKRGSGQGKFGPGTGKFDAYYAQMVFGSAKAFQNKVTGAALQSKRLEVIRIIEQGLSEALGKAEKKAKTAA